MADRDDEELAALADELADVLRELRDELRANRRQRGRRSDGIQIDLPSPPSPGELLTFTDEQLIPAAIAILEANIRALELLQGAIRLARPDRAGEHASSVRSGAESLSRSTLERLDDVLVDLQETAEGGLPPDSEARDVVTEARRLRDEIDAALAERTDEQGPDSGDDEAGQDEENEGERDPFGFEEPPEVDVDVEGELESIRAELGKVEDDDEPVAGEAGETIEDGDDGEADADESASDGDASVTGDGDAHDADEPDEDDGE